MLNDILYLELQKAVSFGNLGLHLPVLREYGAEYEYRPPPGHVKLGHSTTCFQNAYRLAFGEQGNARGWKYIEGYAFRSDKGSAWFHHAWTAEGQYVIDNTWDAAAGKARYVGAAFPEAFVRKCSKTGYCLDSICIRGLSFPGSTP